MARKLAGTLFGTRAPRHAGSDAMCLACRCCAESVPGIESSARNVAQIASSCSAAYASQNDGGTTRIQWFARGTAHIDKISHAACKLPTLGRSARSLRSSSRRASPCRATKAAVPRGVPRTIRPFATGSALARHAGGLFGKDFLYPITGRHSPDSTRPR